jgi:glycosyltransferase involved in cell wall biosynthesis
MVQMSITMKATHPTITVCTPVHNAEDRIEALLTGLQKQTFRDFEWIIADDGSTDGSSTRAQQIAGEQTAVGKDTAFPISLLTQKFLGRHVAVNRAVKAARGEFFTVLDSDALPKPEAFERLLEGWNSIPAQERPYFAGVFTVTELPNGKLNGSLFPASPFDSNSIETGTHYGIGGRKWGLIRTELVRENPYPVFSGEKFVPEELLLNRIGRNRLTRYLNEPLLTVPAPEDKLRRLHNWAGSPRAAALFYNELSEQRIPLSHKIRASAQFVRYSMHAGIIPDNIYKQANKKLITFFMLWPGLVLYKRDQKQLSTG